MLDTKHLLGDFEGVDNLNDGIYPAVLNVCNCLLSERVHKRDGYLVVMQLDALPLQSPVTGAESKAPCQELEPDGRQQGGGVKGHTLCSCLTALLLHPRD